MTAALKYDSVLMPPTVAGRSPDIWLQEVFSSVRYGALDSEVGIMPVRVLLLM